MKKFAVIVAGGKGLRMNSAVPKQFLALNEAPVLYHTIKAFQDADAGMELILVLPPDQLSYAQMILPYFTERIEVTIVPGGETRYHSVQHGLNAIHEEGIVFVHDGVRPLVSADLIYRCYKQAVQLGSAIPAIAVADSIRKIIGEENVPVDREYLRIIQTPQTFRTDLILPAFRQEYDPAFTDEATVVEAHGTKVFLIEGEKSNIKVTTPEDLVIAEALLKAREEHV